MSHFTTILLLGNMVFCCILFKIAFGKMTQFNYTEKVPRKFFHHLATLYLARKFSDLEDNEARYAIPISNPFERAEYEQDNSVNEIINAIHESNSHSLSATLVNEHEESRWWSLHACSAKLQTALITVCAAVSGLAIILLLLWKYKSQLRGVQTILEHFAVNLQNNRRNRIPALTEQQ